MRCNYQVNATIRSRFKIHIGLSSPKPPVMSQYGFNEARRFHVRQCNQIAVRIQESRKKCWGAVKPVTNHDWSLTVSFLCFNIELTSYFYYVYFSYFIKLVHAVV